MMVSHADGPARKGWDSERYSPWRSRWMSEGPNRRWTLPTQRPFPSPPPPSSSPGRCTLPLPLHTQPPPASDGLPRCGRRIDTSTPLRSCGLPAPLARHGSHSPLPSPPPLPHSPPHPPPRPPLFQPRLLPAKLFHRASPPFLRFLLHFSPSTLPHQSAGAEQLSVCPTHRRRHRQRVDVIGAAASAHRAAAGLLQRAVDVLNVQLLC